VRKLCTVAMILLGFNMVSPLRAQRPKSTPPRSAAREDKLLRGADLILFNGKVWTGAAAPGGKDQPNSGAFAQAVAMIDGRILAVGTSEQIRAYAGRDTRLIDIQGRLVVPGFIDSHVHFLDGGFQLLAIDLKDTHTETEFARRLGEKAKPLPPGQWILGGNWDEQAWPSGKLPTRKLIDAVTAKNPVFISRYDGHSALANSVALKMAGVTKNTPDPEAGVIVRDAKGEPTGVLKDAAQDLVRRIVPRPTEADMEQALRAALKEAARVGVTSVHDITLDSESADGNSTREIRLLRRAELEGWLTCRMYEIVPLPQGKKLADAGISRDMGSDFLKLGAVKAFADGSLGSATAWMFEPYADDAGNRGLPTALMTPPARMEELLRGAAQAQIQPAIHAIGDRAVAEVLDLYTRVGGNDPASFRFRIEHAQHVRAEDFARFGKLGVVASMQPYHATDDGRWAEKRIGSGRARTSYAWRSMLKAGAPLAFGSDWPVAPLNPLLGIYAAVTRATLDGKHPGGWNPEERLTVEEALRAYTQGSAYAAFEEKEKGIIAPGKIADLVVLAQDLFSIPPEKIKEARVALTILRGKVVY
jgi:predicted amidohydrolase YtcJ